MRIVVFGPSRRLGTLHEDRILDLDRAAAAKRRDSEPFRSLQSLIDTGDRGLDLIRELEGAFDPDRPDVFLDPSSVELHAPFPGQRFALAGSNNAEHVANALANRGQDITAEQVRTRTRQGKAGGFWVVSTPVGPGAEVPVPSSADGLFDYEAEVAIVLGKGGKRIKAEDWRDYVWGCTLVIDWSLRSDDLATMHQPFYAHKIFDASKSLGPFIAVDDVDPANCEVQTQVNGEVRQHFNTNGMIHSYGELLEQMSADLTLRAGDLLAGGTGPGTAIDSTVVDGPGPISRGLFLKAGDTVTVSAPDLGSLTASIVNS